MGIEDDPAEPSSADLARGAMYGRLSQALFSVDIPPLTVSRFEIQRELGRGGMGSVLAAWDPLLKRRVALKIVPLVGADEESRQRSLREAETLARIANAHVVVVHEAGLRREDLFIVMEYVDGDDLRGWLQQETRSRAEILRAFAEAARGLQAVHDVGVVHCDFKPRNVLVGRDGRVRVADFGLARLAADRTGTPLFPSSPASASSRTRLGGTFPYVSPEQLAAGPANPLSDQFSFCVALWEALEGSPPYTADDLRNAVHRGLSQPQISRRSPRWLFRALARGLAYNPQDRWPQISDLASLLEAAPHRQRRRAGAITIAVASVVGLAAGISGARCAGSDDPCGGSEDEIASVWNAQTSAEIAGKLAAQDSFAGDEWPRVAAALDDYAAAWTEARLLTCRETWSQHRRSSLAFDRSTTCLTRARLAFEGTVSILGEGSPLVFENAERVVAELPHPDECLDEGIDEKGSGGEQSETRGDPALAVVDAARLSMAAGRYGRAILALQTQLAETASTRPASLRAQVHLELARAFEGIGLLRAAERELQDAIADAERGGNDRTRLGALTRLAVLDARDYEKSDAARRSLMQAQALGERLDVDGVESAELSMAAAALASLAGDVGAAEKHLKHAIDQLESSDTWTVLARARARTELANVLAMSERKHEARTLYKEVESSLREELGDRHPALATLAVDLSLDALDRGLVEEARTYAERAHSITVEAFGEGSPRCGTTFTLLARVALRQSAWERAAEYATRGWLLQQLTLERGHSEHASALAALAEAHMGSDLAASLADYLRLEQEFASGANATQLPAVKNNIGYLLCRLDRCEEAYAVLQPLHDSLGKADILRVPVATNLATVEGELGRCDQALARLEALLPVARAPKDGTRSEPFARDMIHEARKRAAQLDPDGAQLLGELLWTSASCKAREPASRDEGRAEAREAQDLWMILGSRPDLVAKLTALSE